MWTRAPIHQRLPRYAAAAACSESRRITARTASGRLDGGLPAVGFCSAPPQILTRRWSPPYIGDTQHDCAPLSCRVEPYKDRLGRPSALAWGLLGRRAY